jgi:hypothetical protein
MKNYQVAANAYISRSKYINKSRSDGVTPLMIASIKGLDSLGVIMPRLCKILIVIKSTPYYH